METNLTFKTMLVAFGLVIAFCISWELYLRHKGAISDYNESPELWANTRDQVYEPSDKTTIFIGSSRIKFDLDISLWERLTHNHAVQLSLTGSSPRLCLTDLANDLKFKGKLIVDVTEDLFFSKYGNLKPDGAITYYKNRTPAQRLSFLLDQPIESNLAFINNEQYDLNSLLSKVKIKDRPGVFPFLDFPASFMNLSYNGQVKMNDSFLSDTNEQNKVKAIWAMFAKDPTPPMHGKPLDSVMLSVKNDVNKIKARGGEVIFIRTPSSGLYLIGEQHGFPRAAYWDRLLKETRCKGIYFKDYPAIANFNCPEFSHLKPADAKIYTTNLINILKKDFGWKFNNN